MQWGYSVVTTQAIGIKQVNFPISFNNLHNVQITGYALPAAFYNTYNATVANAQNDNINAENITNSSFETQSQWTHYWFAIGE